MAEISLSREPRIALGSCTPILQLAPGVELREFVSASCGAKGLSSGTAIFEPGAELPYHLHPFSEAVTVVSGEAEVRVEGRPCYLSQLDGVHFPSGTAHAIVNRSTSAKLVAHWAFATAHPTRQLVPGRFDRDGQPFDRAVLQTPEHIVRFFEAESYELAEDAFFTDLFGRRFGTVGICGGCAWFAPGASLPCHIHRCDESITIIRGEAVCQVIGEQWQLSNCDTAFIPEGRPHRFLNKGSEGMAMIWVYASDEPERTILDPGYCTGGLVWPGRERV